MDNIGNDTAIVLMLADRQREIEALRAENNQLRAMLTQQAPSTPEDA